MHSASETNGGSSEFDAGDPLTAGLAAAFGPRTRNDRAANSQGPASSAHVASPGSIIETLGLRSQVMLEGSDDSCEPVATPVSDEVSQQRVLGRYQILGEIARGGVGVVLKGHDVDLGRDVAMKVLQTGHVANPAMVQRFMEEAQVTGQLQHPGILPVYELGLREDRQPFFTMKLVKGRTLHTLLKERQQPSEDLPLFLNVFEHVCQTLAYAHARGVVHRDLKPLNIMVGPFGEVQVLDWGLARLLAGRRGENASSGDGHSVIETVRSEAGAQSMAGSVMGTPAYMAPEQARGDVDLVDERTDVFALGAILSEILTGRPPYQGSRSEILAQAAACDLGPIQSRLKVCGADAELVALALKCMSRDRHGRPRDASMVATEVNGYIAGIATKARALELAAASAKVRAEEERRSRRLRTALATAVLVVIALVATGLIWNKFQAQARTANANRLIADALGKAREGLAEARTAGVGADAKWTAALSAGHQVETLLGTGEADETSRRTAGEFLEELKSADADRRMIDRLESVVMFGATHQDAESWTWMDDQLILAFRDYGIDVLNMPPEEIARRIRESRIAVNLGYGFELWIATGADLLGRFGVQRYTEKTLRDRVEILYAADPDPYRTAIRQMTFTGAVDLEKLRELAASQPFEQVAPVTLSWLAMSFGMGGDLAGMDDVYHRALLAHPTDLMLNHDFAYVRSNQKRYDEAIPYYRACIAIRPDVGGLWRSLGIALRETGKLSESISALEESNRRQPGHAATFVDLGISLARAERLDEAIAAQREAIRLKPNLAAAHGHLGRALCEQSKFDKALASLKKAKVLMKQDASWPIPIDDWIAECERKAGNEGYFGLPVP